MPAALAQLVLVLALLLPQLTLGAVITFDSIGGATGDQLTLPYSEAGFVATPVTGRWLKAQVGGKVGGNPQPAIYGDTFTATLEITSTSSGTFTFAGFDLASWEFDFVATDSPIGYTAIGLLGGQTVFSTTGEVGTSEFVTVGSP
jgi:hypothetical protein